MVQLSSYDFDITCKPSSTNQDGSRVIQSIHDDKGHHGRDKTLELAKSVYIGLVWYVSRFGKQNSFLL